MRIRACLPWSTTLCALSLSFLAMAQGCSSSDSGAATPAPSSGSSSGDAAAAAKTDAQYQQEVVSQMHDALLADLDALVQAATEMQAAAPTPTGRGWTAEDAAAIQKAKEAWIRARAAYEHIEGALAPIFPDIDASIDARYDDFLSELNGKGDDNLFDDQGVTGLHAVERILWADSAPAHVVDFEKSLPGYKAASFPSTEKEAQDFKNILCKRVVLDATELRDQWQPAKIDIAVAFQGLISLMNEQREKVTKASTNEEESRYSQRTMTDMRANLEGTQKIYALFKPWIMTKANATDPSKDGKAVTAKIDDGLAKLTTIYAGVQGDAIPQPPATFSAESPSPSDLDTPFGHLYSSVKDAVDPNLDGSVVEEMNSAATLLGFPLFKQK